MGGDMTPLERILNKSLDHPPTSQDEVRERLTAGRSGPEPVARFAAPASPAALVSEDPARIRGVPRPGRQDGSKVGTDDHRDLTGAPPDDRPPSLAEVAAQLAALAEELTRREERLSRERISLESPDGLVRFVVAGDGRPVSLHIDKAAVKGPDRRHLGPLIAELIMTARRRADARRDELEMNSHPPRSR